MISNYHNDVRLLISGVVFANEPRHRYGDPGIFYKTEFYRVAFWLDPQTSVIIIF